MAPELEHTFYITFAEHDSPSEKSLLQRLGDYFDGPVGASPDEHISDEHLFLTYEQHTYLITHGSGCGFRHYFKIQSDLEVVPDYPNKGFCGVIYEFIEKELGISYPWGEFVSEFCIQQLKANRAERFLSGRSVYSYIDQPNLPDPAAVHMDEGFQNNDRWCFAEVSRSAVSGPEHAWDSIATAIEYDNFERVAQEFAPMTAEEYQTEISGLSTGFGIPADPFLIPESERVSSVLRLFKEWDRWAYLIRSDRTYRYVEVYPFVG